MQRLKPCIRQPKEPSCTLSKFRLAEFELEHRRLNQRAARDSMIGSSGLTQNDLDDLIYFAHTFAELDHERSMTASQSDECTTAKASKQSTKVDFIDDVSTDDGSRTTTVETYLSSLPGSVGSLDEDQCSSLKEESSASLCNELGFSHSPQSPPYSQRMRKIRQFARILGEKADYRSVRDVFMAADSDGDGRLSDKEVIAVFLHFDLPAETAMELFELMDPAGNSFINWREFMAFAASTLLFKEPAQTSTRHLTWRLVPSVEGQRWHQG